MDLHFVNGHFSCFLPLQRSTIQYLMILYNRMVESYWHTLMENIFRSTLIQMLPQIQISNQH